MAAAPAAPSPPPPPGVAPHTWLDNVLHLLDLLCGHKDAREARGGRESASRFFVARHLGEAARGEVPRPHPLGCTAAWAGVRAMQHHPLAASHPAHAAGTTYRTQSGVLACSISRNSMVSGCSLNPTLCGG